MSGPFRVQLFYDDRDAAAHRAGRSRILDWLADVGARPLSTAGRDEAAFLFAGARPIDDYRRLVAGRRGVRDRAEDREPLLRLDAVLDGLHAAAVDVPTPRTWRLPLDAPVPADLTFPLFVRTAFSSWKLGGHISKVGTRSQLEAESAELRRALGWDALILARQWLDLAAAGRSVYGPVPVEIRTWIVDGRPHAWSFHHMTVVPSPAGFPPTADDLAVVRDMAARVGTAFGSRLVAADFAKTKSGHWAFIEAGPGSCAGTGHERVFKSVAAALRGETMGIVSNAVGGTFDG